MRPLFLVLFGWVTAVLLPSASAQLKVELSMDRDSYVSLETITATVTVTNNVGKDVVLGGPSETSWLDFQISTSAGEPVSPLRPVAVAPLMIRNGESLKRKFSLDKHYYLSDSGKYLLRAAAYFPELQKYNLSPPKAFMVQEPRRATWEEVFSVPDTAGVPGGYRKYQLFTVNDLDKSWIYYSLIDETNQLVLSRAPLGEFVPDRVLQPVVDRNKRLNLIYQSTPSLYTYQQLDPGGQVTALKFYSVSKGIPKLIKEADGATAIMGGAIYDPAAEARKKTAVRKLSDRPGGLTE
ncbi:MAG: hypothetical protein JWM59_840 [Verrucomicrobiales bacterium]|nr:hypothetical protein [Verrucomicrobiales bacterium]